MTARVAGQTAPMAYGAALQKSTLFLFGRADHGGLRKVEGLVAYPTAFPPTPPAPPSPAAAAAPQVSNPPASSSSPAEPEPAEGVASEQAAKRARVDAGGDGAVAAAAGASLTPIQQLGPALTDASPTEQVRPRLFYSCLTLSSATAALVTPHTLHTGLTQAHSRRHTPRGGGRPRFLVPTHITILHLARALDPSTTAVQPKNI